MGSVRHLLAIYVALRYLAPILPPYASTLSAECHLAMSGETFPKHPFIWTWHRTFHYERYGYTAEFTLATVWFTDALTSRSPYVAQDDNQSDDSDHDGKSMKNDSDHEESTQLGSDEEIEEATEVDIMCGNIAVTWKAADGQIQRTDGLYLDLFMDISTTNTAIFKLYGYILLKANKGKSSKQAIYLFIYPESIRAITLETIHDAPSQPSTNLGSSHHSLSFSLTTQPHLVVPQDLILESRQKTFALLDSIRALTTMVNFTVSFSNADTVASTLHSLRLVASVFSPTSSDSRPSTNARRANLNALYAGRGGEIVHTNDATANAAVRPPPLYSEPTPGPSQISSSFSSLGYLMNSQTLT